METPGPQSGEPLRGCGCPIDSDTCICCACPRCGEYIVTAAGTKQCSCYDQYESQ